MKEKEKNLENLLEIDRENKRRIAEEEVKKKKELEKKLKEEKERIEKERIEKELRAHQERIEKEKIEQENRIRIQREKEENEKKVIEEKNRVEMQKKNEERTIRDYTNLPEFSNQIKPEWLNEIYYNRFRLLHKYRESYKLMERQKETLCSEMRRVIRFYCNSIPDDRNEFITHYNEFKHKIDKYPKQQFIYFFEPELISRVQKITPDIKIASNYAKL